MCDDERIFLSKDAAIAFLPDKDGVHMVRSGWSGLILGCDISKDDAIEKIRNCKEVEVSGPVAQEMKHGLCVWFDDCDYVFFETKFRTDQQMKGQVC